MDLRPFLESAVTVPYNKQHPLGRTMIKNGIATKAKSLLRIFVSFAF